MTKKKANAPKKTNQRIMREQRRVILEAMGQIAFRLRGSSEEARNKSVEQAIKHGGVEAPESVQEQLVTVAFKMAAEAVDERAAKLKRTWK